MQRPSFAAFRQRHRLAVLSLGWIALVGCVDEATVADDSLAIVGGTLDPDDSAVVALVAGGEQFCTGTVISEYDVVTAAHCLPPNAPFELEDITVFFGTDLSQGGDMLAVASAIAHSGWLANALGNDIGLLELATPADVVPAQTATDMDAFGVVGQSVRVVGFGTNKTDGPATGVKRTGQMAVADVDDTTIYLEPETAATCYGDSGGPLFVPGDSGEVLVGVHSRSDCQDTSLAERVDVHSQFLGAVSDETAECRDTPDDFDCVERLTGSCAVGGSPRSALLTWLLILFVIYRSSCTLGRRP